MSAKIGLEKLGSFTEDESEVFQRAVNTLVSNTFLVRSIERDRSLYKFVLMNFDVFEDYFFYAGWSLRKDEHLGVITWYGPSPSRLRLNLEETLCLLVFRVIYEEKKGEINLGTEPSVRQEEFMNKYKVFTGRQLKKTATSVLLRRLQSLKLIRCLGSETDPDTVILLYPSIPFALDKENIDSVYRRITELSGNEPGGDEETIEEEEE